MSDRRRWQLEGDLRQAFENYMGGSMVSGPWDAVINLVAEAVDLGSINLEGAAALNIALGRTQGADAPEQCGVCDCPCPGMAHR